MSIADDIIVCVNTADAGLVDDRAAPDDEIAVLRLADEAVYTPQTSPVRTREHRLRLTQRLFDLAPHPIDACVSTEVEKLRRAVEERVCLLNKPVAYALASLYRNRGVALDDLEQVAHMAMVVAARRFTPERSDHFLTFVVPTIRGSLQKYFRDSGWMVRPPRSVQELQARAVATRDCLEDKKGVEPTTSEIARELGVDSELVERALGASGCFTPLTLDIPSTATSYAKIADRLHQLSVSAGHGDDLVAAEIRAMLAPALRDLSPDDRRILHLRFVEERTQREIAERTGTSHTQVSRHLQLVLSGLRQRLEEPVDRTAGHRRIAA